MTCKDKLPIHLQNLNPPQLEATQHYRGPILILAGAGSGKTRVLTRRVVHLVREYNVAPHRILAVTFTNKATDEMKKRLTEMLGDGYAQPWVSTFHSACLRILRRHATMLGYKDDFVVYDAKDTKTVLKTLLKDLGIDEKTYPVVNFQKAIDRAKNSYIFPAEYLERLKGLRPYEDNLTADVYDKYQKELLRSNAMDFGDLLVNAVRLFKEFPDTLRLYQHQLQFVLVDEFQDTNKVQYMFVRQLVEPRGNLLVVGDDDQSIYAFRGANVSNILNFEKDFPETKVVKLEQNYRSTANILDAANDVIKKNKTRKKKKLWTAGKPGKPIEMYCGEDEQAEAQYVVSKIKALQEKGTALSEMAIFYRTNAQSRALEDALMNARILYRIFGGQKFYERKEIKDILAYLKLAINEDDNQSFLRVVNTPPRGIGAQSLKSIVDVAKAEHCSLLAATKLLVDDDVQLGLIRARESIKGFVKLMQEIHSKAQKISVSDLVAFVIEASSYGERLGAIKDVTAVSRLENLEELKAVARSMVKPGLEPLEQLRNFLDRASLSTSDELPVEQAHSLLEKEEDKEKQVPQAVSLMTLHLAKGLEFPYVFLTGLEEGLIPHSKSMFEEEDVAEERRLCYVGMTRAISVLHLTRAQQRGMFSSGSSFGVSGQYREASRFAFDIPERCVSKDSSQFFEGVDNSEYDEFDDYDVFFDEDELEKDLNSSTKKKKTKAALITSAEDLATSGSGYLEDSCPVKLEEIKPGLKVHHPSFGAGVIKEIKNNKNDAKLSKILVHFDKLDKTKKLVFKYAKLMNVE